MVGRRRVSRGGQANEAGSLHRSGVAAYLAAHGLVGRAVEAVGYSAGDPAPVMLAFETEQAVDDIRCSLADGTALKRRVPANLDCGPISSEHAGIPEAPEVTRGLRHKESLPWATQQGNALDGQTKQIANQAYAYANHARC